MISLPAGSTYQNFGNSTELKEREDSNLYMRIYNSAKFYNNHSNLLDILCISSLPQNQFYNRLLDNKCSLLPWSCLVGSFDIKLERSNVRFGFCRLSINLYFFFKVPAVCYPPAIIDGRPLSLQTKRDKTETQKKNTLPPPALYAGINKPSTIVAKKSHSIF